MPDKMKKPQPKVKLRDLIAKKAVKGGATSSGGTCTTPKPPGPAPIPYPNQG